MNADHILTCHGYCRADREALLAKYPGLGAQLEKLPKTYRADDVAAAIEKAENAKPPSRDGDSPRARRKAAKAHVPAS